MPAHRLTAVLGPTNTGKTHLAVTRMCGYASGMMGFPLRLLAREVYDRVVAIKGAAQVALITGEEKIAPPTARYWLCTVEAMPRDVQAEFVAIDEVQLAADPDRGHVFTDRMLHMRGTDETMLLGADTIAPLVRHLLPDAFIDSRPRFSKLTYAGAKKLSRIPRRAAIIAFTADEVYALAEMLRRQKGGAAVVMGALSPRTRNAQVALYQSGEVDYLVATDAIGMGLNLDLEHVAFASLSKFDGRQQRRLRPAEIGQIAGRAGRYQTDGQFGTLSFGADETGPMLTPEEIEAVEGHDFERVRFLHWRNARLDWASLPRLIASLEVRPPDDALKPVVGATDAAVLKACSADEKIAALATSRERIQRLWEVCNLPDYRKTGPNAHARLVGRIYRHVVEDGAIPRAWIGAELARLEDTQGGIEAIAGRIAAARTWTYAAHRSGWVDDPEEWSARAKALENKLSDALHERLTQRFVDRRTALLMQDLAGTGQLPVEVEADGSVLVAGEPIGTLTGFRFKADPSARAGETRRLLSAAERHLPTELTARVAAMLADDPASLTIAMTGKLPPRILWQGARVAKLAKGSDALSPRLVLDRALDALAPSERGRIAAHLSEWLAREIETHLAPLRLLAEAAADADATAPARGLSVQLIEALGVLPRKAAAPLLSALSPDDHKFIGRAGVVIGATHLFVPDLLKPAPTALRVALWAVASGAARLPPVPQPGLTSITAETDAPHAFYEAAGFGRFGARAIRLDMAERVARAAAKMRKGPKPFAPDENWAHMLGLSPDELAIFMKALGYRRTQAGEEVRFSYRPQAPKRGPKRQPRAPEKKADPNSPFAALADLKEALSK